MMNNSNKKFVHQSSIKAFARALSKVRRPEVDTHTLRNGTLQIPTLLIQSIYLLVNKPPLLSTPTSQSARSHTTLALKWTSTPESKFWLKESQYTSLRYHLVEIPAYNPLIFNSVSLLVKTWQLWSNTEMTAVLSSATLTGNANGFPTSLAIFINTFVDVKSSLSPYPWFFRRVEWMQLTVLQV